MPFHLHYQPPQARCPALLPRGCSSPHQSVSQRLWHFEHYRELNNPRFLPPSILINVNAFSTSLWPSSAPPRPACSLNCTSLCTWGQFLERLAAGADRLRAPPHLGRPNSIKSISTGSGRSGAAGCLQLGPGTLKFHSPPHSCQQQHKIHKTSPRCSWHWSSVEPGHVIPESLKSLSRSFPLTIQHCMQLPIPIFSFAKH